jgi:hypothetical protein
MEVCRAHADATVPEPLLNSEVPPAVPLRLEREVHPENLVLAGRGLKPVAMLACTLVSVFRDEVAACEAIGPDVAELIEMVVAAAGDEI